MNFKLYKQATMHQEILRRGKKVMESAAQGKVVDASVVHSWLNSWGTDKEKDKP